MAQEPIHYTLLDSIRATFWYDSIKTTYAMQYIGWLAESHARHNEPIDFSDTHEPLTEINTAFLDETFDSLPDEAKQLMDVTEYLAKLAERNKTQDIPGWISVTRTYSHTFTKEFGRIGQIQVLFTEEYFDNDCELRSKERETTETYTIPAVIFTGYKYYALTPAFIAWCRTPDKPKRARWLDTLTYQV